MYFQDMMNLDQSLKGLKGYEIIRKSTKCKAHKLSEGEKTAIAFVYFLTKLK